MQKLLIYFFTLLLIVGCNKDDNNSNNNNPTNTNGLSVKINGILWEGSFIANMVDDATEQFIVSSVKFTSNETLGFTMDYFDGPGTYPKAKDNSAFVSFARADKKVFYNLTGSGIIFNVTSVETVAGVNKVHGNFSGTLKSNDGEVLQFTDGNF